MTAKPTVVELGIGAIGWNFDRPITIDTSGAVTLALVLSLDRAMPVRPQGSHALCYGQLGPCGTRVPHILAERLTLPVASGTDQQLLKQFRMPLHRVAYAMQQLLGFRGAAEWDADDTHRLFLYAISRTKLRGRRELRRLITTPHSLLTHCIDQINDSMNSAHCRELVARFERDETDEEGRQA